jgi:hypothetical protein
MKNSACIPWDYGLTQSTALNYNATRVIASIVEQQVTDKILKHLQAKGVLPPPPELLPATRGLATRLPPVIYDAPDRLN